MDDLIVFYQTAGNREWQRLLNDNGPFGIEPDDFAHAEFCLAVVRSILIASLQLDLEKNPDQGQRFRAAVRIDEYWHIEKKFAYNWN